MLIGVTGAAGDSTGVIAKSKIVVSITGARSVVIITIMLKYATISVWLADSGFI